MLANLIHRHSAACPHEDLEKRVHFCSLLWGKEVGWPPGWNRAWGGESLEAGRAPNLLRPHWPSCLGEALTGSPLLSSALGPTKG